MKSLYLKAGKTESVFNDLKDSFNGNLWIHNDEYRLDIRNNFARGTIKGITFPDGLTYMQFEMIFNEETRLSMESLKTSPLFFVYCLQGNVQHSFGEMGERKNIKNQHSGILKSTSRVNSILYFEKNRPIQFYVIQVGTNTENSNEYNDELVKKLKNTFFHINEDYLEISAQDFEITKQLKELNALNHKGIVRNLYMNRILEKILEIEIEQHTDGFSVMAAAIKSFASQQINEIIKISNFASNLYLELFTTDIVIQKAVSFKNKLQKEFKLLFSRSLHEVLIFMRIERGRI